jgi:hypothetical protein
VSTIVDGSVDGFFGCLCRRSSWAVVANVHRTTTDVHGVWEAFYARSHRLAVNADRAPGADKDEWEATIVNGPKASAASHRQPREPRHG